MRLGTKMAVSLQRSHKGLQENVHRNRPLTRLLSGFYCPAACFPPWASILLSRPGESLTFIWGRGKMGLSWSMRWPFIPSSPVWIPCLWVPFKLFWWLIQQQLTAVLSVAAEWRCDEVWGWVGAPSWTRPASNYSLGGITKLLCVYHRVCVIKWEPGDSGGRCSLSLTPNTRFSHFCRQTDTRRTAKTLVSLG